MCVWGCSLNLVIYDKKIIEILTKQTFVIFL